MYTVMMKIIIYCDILTIFSVPKKCSCLLRFYVVFLCIHDSSLNMYVLLTYEGNNLDKCSMIYSTCYDKMFSIFLMQRLMHSEKN